MIDISHDWERAAEWCAERGLKGVVGDPLPEGISVAAWDAISAAPEAFAETVARYAYARAMRSVQPEG